MTDPLRAQVDRHYRAVAPFLEQELAGRGDEQLWQSLAGEQPGRRILELGAGSGRVTRLLAPGARLVVAVDICEDQIRRARDRLMAFPWVKLVQADMRRLALRQSFDLVVAANDPFCHLLADDDRRSALAVVARHLAPGGRFILDALWFAPPDARALADTGGLVRERTVALDGSPLRVRERWRWDLSAAACRARFEYARAGTPVGVSEFSARAWTPGGLRSGLAAAGLVIDALWGDYNRAEWDPDTSSKLVAVARGAGGRPATGGQAR
jgi:SAM-dependent methyltransferase